MFSGASPGGRENKKRQSSRRHLDGVAQGPCRIGVYLVQLLARDWTKQAFKAVFSCPFLAPRFPLTGKHRFDLLFSNPPRQKKESMGVFPLIDCQAVYWQSKVWFLSLFVQLTILGNLLVGGSSIFL